MPRTNPGSAQQLHGGVCGSRSGIRCLPGSQSEPEYCVDCLLGVGGGRNQHVTSINNDVDHLAVALEMSVQMFISVRALASATARYRVRSPSG